MAFVTVEDYLGEIELIVFPNLYRKFSEYLTQDSAIFITGALSSREEDDVKVLAQHIRPLTSNSQKNSNNVTASVANSFTEPKQIFIRFESFTSTPYQEVVKILPQLAIGATEIVFYSKQTQKYQKLSDKKLLATPKLIEYLNRICGKENVILR